MTTKEFNEIAVEQILSEKEKYCVDILKSLHNTVISAQKHLEINQKSLNAALAMTADELYERGKNGRSFLP